MVCCRFLLRLLQGQEEWDIKPGTLPLCCMHCLQDALEPPCLAFLIHCLLQPDLWPLRRHQSSVPVAPVTQLPAAKKKQKQIPILYNCTSSSHHVQILSDQYLQWVPHWFAFFSGCTRIRSCRCVCTCMLVWRVGNTFTSHDCSRTDN